MIPLLQFLEIFSLNLTKSEIRQVIRKIKEDPHSKVLLIKASVLQDYYGKPEEPVILSQEMGIIPRGLAGTAVDLSFPGVLDEADRKHPSPRLRPPAWRKTFVVSVAAVLAIPIEIQGVVHYLLTVNRNKNPEWTRKAISPIGGILRVRDPSARTYLETLNVKLNEAGDLKFRVGRSNLWRLFRFLLSGRGRDVTPLRELMQEAVGPGSEFNVFHQLPKAARLWLREEGIRPAFGFVACVRWIRRLLSGLAGLSAHGLMLAVLLLSPVGMRKAQSQAPKAPSTITLSQAQPVRTIEELADLLAMLRVYAHSHYEQRQGIMSGPSMGIHGQLQAPVWRSDRRDGFKETERSKRLVMDTIKRILQAFPHPDRLEQWIKTNKLAIPKAWIRDIWKSLPKKTSRHVSPSGILRAA